MPSSKFTYDLSPGATSHVVKEEQIELSFIGKLQGLKYEYRADIRDRAALERNFREKFEALNRVHLSDGEFARLLDSMVTPDVFTAARTLRGINAFTDFDRALPKRMIDVMSHADYPLVKCFVEVSIGELDAFRPTVQPTVNGCLLHDAPQHVEMVTFDVASSLSFI